MWIQELISFSLPQLPSLREIAIQGLSFLIWKIGILATQWVLQSLNDNLKLSIGV